MMMGFAPVSIDATAVTSSTVFEGNAKRRYFAVYGDVDSTITIDGASFTLPAGVPYAPIPAPINAITVDSTSATVLEG